MEGSLISTRREYVALLGSLVLVALEGVIRILTLALRKSVHPDVRLVPLISSYSATDHQVLLQ